MKSKYYLKMWCFINKKVEILWYTGVDVILNKDKKYAYGYGFKFLAINTAETLMKENIFTNYEVVSEVE